MNMRKIVAGILACCIVGGVLPVADVIPENIVAPVTALAVESGVIDSGTTEDGLEYEIYGTYEYVYDENGERVQKVFTRDYAVISGYSGSKSVVSVPDFIGDITVTHIGGYSFQNNSSITSVTLPDTIEIIESYAFYDCTSLTKINIPDSVTSISDSAFRNCSSLVSMTLPDSVDAIGGSAFEGCSSLVKIKLPANITFIEEALFSGCFKLASIDIPESVVTIKSNAFGGCTALTKLVIPDSVLNINSWAFSDCSGLTSVKLPKDLTSIADNLFYYCSSLISINLPDDVTSIGSAAFEGCTSLNKIKFSPELSVIKNSAFQNTGFTEIAIPDGIAVIDASTFRGCANLKNVTIPDSVERIANNAFWECESLKNITIPQTVKILEDDFFGGWYFLFDSGLYDDITISGYKGSVAETYANENNITFISLGETSTTEPITGGELEATLLGDANCDGKVTIADATAIIQHLGNSDEYALSEQGEANADIVDRGDGITGADANAIQAIEAGFLKQTDFPIAKADYDALISK